MIYFLRGFRARVDLLLVGSSAFALAMKASAMLLVLLVVLVVIRAGCFFAAGLRRAGLRPCFLAAGLRALLAPFRWYDCTTHLLLLPSQFVPVFFVTIIYIQSIHI